MDRMTDQKPFSFLSFFFLAILGFELRASYLVGRLSYHLSHSVSHRNQLSYDKKRTGCERQKQTDIQEKEEEEEIKEKQAKSGWWEGDPLARRNPGVKYRLKKQTTWSSCASALSNSWVTCFLTCEMG
jgi:hypothetical protein